MRKERPFYLTQRKGSPYFYYKFRHGGSYKSTGCKTEKEAEQYVKRLMDGESATPLPELLADFTSEFFVEGKCKWLARQKKKNKRCGDSNRQNRRGFLVNHISPASGHNGLSRMRKSPGNPI